MNKFVVLGLAALAGLASCSKEKDEVSGKGYLLVSTSLNSQTTQKAAVTDPNEFKLTICKKSDGAIVKEFGKVSEVGGNPIELEVGTYIVKTSSNNFTTADWETPLYEATDEVTVVAENTTTATLTNTQANAGVKVSYTDDFKAKFTDYQTAIESANGNLTFVKEEKRIGYFSPGTIAIKVTADGVAYEAFTKAVSARELVNVSISYSPTPGNTGKITLTITVDNTVTEKDEEIIINPDGGGEIPEPEPGTPIFSEDFASAMLGTTTGDGGDAWKPNSNFVAMEKVYQAGGTVRLGSSSAMGYLETKAIDLSGNNGEFTISFKIKGWTNSGTALVIVNGETQEVSFSSDKLSATLEQKSVRFTNGTAATTIRFETPMVANKPSRFFIDDVTISQ